MSMIAIPWYFAQKDQLAMFGIVYIITNVVSLFWMPLSGTIIDKYNRKHVFLFIALFGGLILSGITLLGFEMGTLPLMVVGCVFMLTFLNYNIHYPCLYAFVQEITEPKYYYKISSLLEIVGQITTISAGAGATLLLEGTTNGFLEIFGLSFYLGFDISPWQIHEIFAIDALTYFIGFFIILMIRYVPVVVRRTETGNMFERLKMGYSYLMDNKHVLIFGVLSFMVFLAMLLEAFYLGVSYVSNHLHESGDVYANSKMAYSLGAIFIGLTIRHLFRLINIPLVIIVMTFVAGGIFLSLSLSNSLIVFFSMMVLLGITNAGVRVARMSYLFKNVENQFFGRAGSIFFIVNVIMRILLLSIFSLAFFQKGNHVIYAYWILAVILFGSSILMIRYYKRFDLGLSND